MTYVFKALGALLVALFAVFGTFKLVTDAWYVYRYRRLNLSSDEADETYAEYSTHKAQIVLRLTALAAFDAFSWWLAFYLIA